MLLSFRRLVPLGCGVLIVAGSWLTIGQTRRKDLSEPTPAARATKQTERSRAIVAHSPPGSSPSAALPHAALQAGETAHTDANTDVTLPPPVATAARFQAGPQAFIQQYAIHDILEARHHEDSLFDGTLLDEMDPAQADQEFLQALQHVAEQQSQQMHLPWSPLATRPAPRPVKRLTCSRSCQNRSTAPSLVPVQ